MKQLKKFGLSLALICALASVTAAFAAAHEFSVETGTIPATTSTSGGTFELKSSIGTTAINITCKKLSGTGELKTAGKDASTLSFAECSLTEPAADKTICAVPTISATTNTELETVGTKLYDTFLPTTEGGKFATVKITGEECPLAGSYEVKGKTAGFDSTSSTFQVEHTQVFSKTITEEEGGALTFGGKAATLSGSGTTKLTGTNAGKKFKGV